MVFFFKQKTAYELRISDWSSDVCSSDLIDDAAAREAIAMALIADRIDDPQPLLAAQHFGACARPNPRAAVGGIARIEQREPRVVDPAVRIFEEIGRASCRARVCQYG